MPKKIDKTGQHFGRLLAIRFNEQKKKWFCLCVCGNTALIHGNRLVGDKYTKSCGCLFRETRKHAVTHGAKLNGKVKSEYRSYQMAKNRCQNPRTPDFKYYGARGIEFKFNSYEEFIACLGPKPTPKHTIERIKNNGHYEIGNVRWATRAEQSRNRRPSSEWGKK